MSTSDQQGHGPLTRKQLREIRLTGSTPVISSEEAAAAAEAAPPAPPLPRAAEPVQIEPAPLPVPVADEANGDAPLTRRQVREQEKARTGSVSVIGADEAEAAAPAEEPEAAPAEPLEEEAPQQEEAPAVAAAEVPAEIVSGVPDFAPTVDAGDDDDDDVDDEVAIAPVSASVAADTVGDVPLEAVDTPADAAVDEDDVEAALGLPVEGSDEAVDGDVLADVDDADEDDEDDTERPTVNSSFGEGLLADAPEVHTPFRPSFDELIGVGDSTGSQHSAPNALIFTPSPGEGSLSGPVASTGEILVTGSYELPQGMGSQGHALGTTDGKDIDAVLIDGELPPASSPTPIAASAAVSTIKPAGEVIRPPAPEKGNRLMVTLAIIAGGLALAIGVVLVIAFTTKMI
ncbi:hypothetical protein HCX50_18220 [Microbacterium oxydans]|uniref:hypothetical protein n=1 Tax=Microbacterium sp. B19(2022) TaxID=2914045 RepID=UPI0014314766|nr:hypothetical protein [Microbacterium sp. B19(2022)]NJI61365.1 hypothetical protein [Microbacterium sp. B19(2022)]